MCKKVLNQFSEGVYLGDAVSDHAFQIRGWLRELGYKSEIYAERIQLELAGDVFDVRSYQPSPDEKFIIYHHAVGANIVNRLLEYNLPITLIYHNITPAEFYEDIDPVLADSLKIGRRQLIDLRESTILAIADSAYNALELQNLAYRETVVLPIVLNEVNYDGPLNNLLADKLNLDRPLLLFVGRLVPNKRQEDLLSLLFYYCRLVPEAQLVLIGSLDDESYVDWLREIAVSLGLKDGTVIFTGHVSQQDLVTYYRSADLYVSMSEHEGFGKPIIESMYFNLPILAYGAAAVPGTIANSGVLFYDKDFEKIAELIHIILNDQGLKERIIYRQRMRVNNFLEPQVKKQFLEIITKLESTYIPS